MAIPPAPLPAVKIIAEAHASVVDVVVRTGHDLGHAPLDALTQAIPHVERQIGAHSTPPSQNLKTATFLSSFFFTACTATPG
jgi:hypothetical protein